MGCGEVDRIIPTRDVVGRVLVVILPRPFPRRQRTERLPPLSGRHLAARTRRPARAGRSGHFECRPGYRASGRDCAQHGLVRLGSSSLYLCRTGAYWGDAPRRCQDRAVDQKWYFGVASSDLSLPTGTMRPCGTRKRLPTGGVGVTEHRQRTARGSVLGLGSRDYSVNCEQ